MAGSTAARYVRGRWSALVTEQGTALLHPSIGEERVRGVWSALSEGAGVSGCLEVLAADGLVDLPSFGLVQHGQGELRVLVRGEVQISAAEQVLGAAGIATWREALVPAQSYRIFVADDDAAGVAWPLAAGVVLASEVEWLGAAPEVTGAAQAGVQAAEAAQGQAEVEGATAAQDAAVSSPEVAAPVPAVGPVADGGVPHDGPATDEGPQQDEPATGSGVEQTEVSPAVEQSDEHEIAAVADDGLQAAAESGEPVEAPDAVAAEEAPGEEEQPEAGAAPVSEETQVGQLSERRPTHPAPSLAAEGSEIIDSLPWAVSTADREQAAATAPAAEAPQSSAPEPAADDLPEHTVLSPRGPNAAAAAAAASSPVPPWQPPSDMPPPSAAAPAYGQGDVDIDGDHDGHTIMVSELPKDQDMTIVPGLGDTDLYDEPGQRPAGAPALSLSVSTGAEVPLDRPVLIGRAPESARFSAGVQPRLVTVPSPQQDISRTHVEIRAEAGSAVVTDLNSTNGTVVVQPGAAPRRLHAGEGASVPAGTLIDLGDGVTVNVHPTDQAGT
ncbi:FHA domain-containing protein [Ruania albidiflava]|uniref:FHA domain-containing protein n=1 Tax=Ruania albidiflava TaxID=366586 RepID=UPI0023F0AFC6|nr:FHA domain-containing protein [Ruania albidiflava]